MELADNSLMEALLLLKGGEGPDAAAVSPTVSVKNFDSTERNNFLKAESMDYTTPESNQSKRIDINQTVDFLPKHVQLAISIVALQFEVDPMYVNSICLSYDTKEWPKEFSDCYALTLRVIEESLLENKELDHTTRLQCTQKIEENKKAIQRFAISQREFNEKLEVIGMRPEEYINTLPETGIPVYTVESTRPLTISDGDANADDNSDKGNNHQRSGYGSDEESSPVLDHAIFIQSSEVTIRNVDRQNTTRKVFKLAPLVEERKSDKHFLLPLIDANIYDAFKVEIIPSSFSIPRKGRDLKF